MSNYYISKCCGEQVTFVSSTTPYFCQGCKLPCEITTMIDKPNGVPEVTEDGIHPKNCPCNFCNPIIKEQLKQEAMIGEAIASAELAEDKTEQIREEFRKILAPESLADNSVWKYVCDWWLQKLEDYKEDLEIEHQKEIREALEEQRQEAHETNNGWCCACDYDQIELNRRLEEQKQEIIKKTKESLIHHNELYRKLNDEILNTFLEIIKN